MKKRLLISVGGTGGHIYPAIALAQQLKQIEPALDILFIGGHLNSNRFFQGAEFQHLSISCGTLSLKKPFKSIFNIGKILKGIWQSKTALEQFQPDLLVGFGSYHTFPTMVAAKLMGAPFILHASDRIPGKVIRLFSKDAKAITVNFPDTVHCFNRPSFHVNMPLRDGFKLGLHSQEKARSYFGLEKDYKTLLVFGGSQGAASINRVISDAVDGNLGKFQVIHIAGNKTDCLMLQEKYKSKGILASVKEFETKMEFAWQAADFVISRSGAVSIAEQLEFEVPGILIPYPYAAENHQEKNALFMSKIIGGSQIILEQHLNKEVLNKSLQSFMNDQLVEQKVAIQKYKNTHKPKNLCSFVLELMDRKN